MENSLGKSYDQIKFWNWMKGYVMDKVTAQASDLG